MMDVSGERLLPEQQRGQLVHAEHLARYRFAAQFAAGARVLDAASGEGYGAAILAAGGAASVTGVDIDAHVVDAAREKYGLEFHASDVVDMPFADDSFDVAVSFETIEHVPDAAKAVAELRRVLRPGGRLVVSTPNSLRYRADNEFHAREYTPEEFRELLTPHFPDVRFYYQQDWLTSAVLGEEQFAQDDEDAPLGLELTKVRGHSPGEQLFTVAVCGEESPTASETAVMTDIFEAHELLAWIPRALAAEAWIERSLEAERQLSQAREKVATMEASLSWRVTRPVRAIAARLRRTP